MQYLKVGSIIVYISARMFFLCILGIVFGNKIKNDEHFYLKTTKLITAYYRVLFPQNNQE